MTHRVVKKIQPLSDVHAIHPQYQKITRFNTLNY